MPEHTSAPADVERLLEEASSAIDRGNWAEALRCAQAVLEISPDHMEAAGVVALASRRAQRAAREPGDRRQMTVMFCDVVGSTEYATSLDPEDMRELLRIFQQTAAEIIDRYDGYVAQFMGDGFLAYFGYPRAHEDAPRRAVLAGLDLVEALRTQTPLSGEAADLHMNVRVGIHSGLVVIAGIGGDSPTARFGDAYGETLHVAARAQANALPSTVEITAATAELVTGYFRLESLGAKSFKGVDRPIEMFRVHRTTGAEARLEAVATRTPLIGRAEERSALIDAWRRADDGASEMIHLSGEAGIGKSRLVEFIADRAREQDAAVIGLQCSAFHTGTALYPVRRAIERMAAVPDGADQAMRRERLMRYLGEHGLDDPPNLTALSVLSSMEVPDDAQAGLSPEQIREQLFQLILGLVHGHAGEHALLVVAEDVHWADASTHELLRRLADHPPPHGRLTLLTSRPGVDIDASAVEIRLGPLSPDDQRELVGVLSGPVDLSDGIVATIVERSDGVPLFVEELTRSIRTDTHVAQGGGSLPRTLSDLLHSRLDRFPVERPLAQLVATVGRPVSLEMLQTLGAKESDELLGRLEVLVEGGILRTAEPGVYEFSHALLRDAAYESQLMSRRRELHATVAAALARVAGEEDIDLLAHHLQEAGDLEQAASWWHRAGRREMSLAALPAAIGHLERAIGLVEQLSRSSPRLHFEIQSDLSNCLLQARGYTSDETEAAFAKALRLSKAAGVEDLVPTLYGLWAYYTIRADYARGWEISQQALDVARARNDRSDLVGAHAMAGYVQMMRGDFAEGARVMREAADALDEDLPQRLPHSPPIAGLVHLATLQLALGYPESGEATMGRALGAATHLDDAHVHFQLAYAHVFAAFHYCTAREYARAIEHGAKAVQISEEHGYTSWWGAGTMNMMLAGVLAEPTAQGIEGFIAVYNISTAMGIRAFAPWYLAGLGEACLRFGDLEAARRRCDDAIAFVDEFGEALYRAEAYRVRGDVRTTAGEAAGASDLEMAVEVAREQGARWFELRALTSLTRTSPSQYASDLRALLDSLDQGADSPDVRAAHALLEENS